MEIKITEEQLQALKKKREQEARDAENMMGDPGTENLCIGCE